MKAFIIILSGFLCGALYAFPSAAFLSWIVMIPYLYIIIKSVLESPYRLRTYYRYGFLFSFAYFTAIFHWFWYQYNMDFLGLTFWQNIAYVLIAWLGLSFLYSLTLGLLPLLFALTARTGLYRKSTLFAPVVLAGMWAVTEWLHSKTWMGVPWGKLAVTQREYLAVLQPVSVLGSYYISFLIVAVNAFLALALYKCFTHRKLKPGAAAAGLAAVFLAANLIWGASLLAWDKKAERQSDRRISVALLQGNLLTGEKWESSAEDNYQLYEDLALEAAAAYSPQMIFFPESAVPVDLSRYPMISERLCELAVECNAVLFVGAFETDPETQENYNVIYQFLPDGTKTEEYYKKQHLVPFGEYLPMRSVITALIPMLGDINALANDLTPGEHSVVFDTEYGGVGTLICFDSIYELLTLDTVRAGAELLAISTNDSWFLDSAAIYEHNGQAILRAIETRRYVARAANSGLSAIISARGELTESLAPLERGIVAGEVVLRDDQTFYTKTGNLFILALHLFLWGIPVCFFARQKAKKFKKSS